MPPKKLPPTTEDLERKIQDLEKQLQDQTLLSKNEKEEIRKELDGLKAKRTEEPERKEPEEKPPGWPW